LETVFDKGFGLFNFTSITFQVTANQGTSPIAGFECSLPGVFAAGDIRSSSIKRVASEVGEGSIAISFVHQVIQQE
jgi:thioredoxin reductase